MGEANLNPSAAKRAELVALLRKPISVPWPPRTKRDLIEHAKRAYEAHALVNAIDYPDAAPIRPWDEQDAAVREAWIEHITPEERIFA